MTKCIQIEKEYQFWVEQQGNFQQCHLEFFTVMIKTESYNVQGGRHSSTQEFREECANYIVEVMEEDSDITPDNPMRHTFSVFLSRELCSVRMAYIHSGIDRYDWFLRVVLASAKEGYLVQRNFPLVIDEQ
ncbi:hypothetical protein AGMMS50229_18300 [Campylobacterota bacterium]|nr:hypothetical protein AGMMS50229_18300 [Campylobacterota bacterium]